MDTEIQSDKKEEYPVKTITQKHNLTRAAKLLVKEFGTPSKLIGYLTQAIRLVALYEYEKPTHPTRPNREDYYFPNELIKHVAIPWVNGGKNTIAEIAAGLKEMWDYDGHEGYCEGVGNIIMAFGFQISQMDARDDPGEFAVLSATLLKITDMVYDYE